MDQEKVEAFSLVIEVSMLVLALCISISIGLLVAPWAGFMTFGGFVAVFIAVIAASFGMEKRKREQENQR